jgi:hypothetical protein
MNKKVAKAVKEKTRKTSISLIKLQAVLIHTLLTEQLSFFYKHSICKHDKQNTLSLEVGLLS